MLRGGTVLRTYLVSHEDDKPDLLRALHLQRHRLQLQSQGLGGEGVANLDAVSIPTNPLLQGWKKDDSGEEGK